MEPPGGISVAKKKSESRRYNTLVRLDDELCEKAKRLAALKGVSMAEMFTGVLRPWVDREWSKEVRRLKDDEAKGGKG